MRAILNTIVGKCAVAFEVTRDGCRLTGNGLVGVTAVAVLMVLLASYAPELLHFFVRR
jgi:hypothetical protein